MPLPQLNWLPVCADFRQELAAANANRAMAGFAALAQKRLGFLETIQLDNAFRKQAIEPGPEFTRIRLALLSSCTIDHLAPPIRVGGLRRQLLIDVCGGAFGQYRQELLDNSSALHAFSPQVVLLSLSPREAISGIPLDASSEEAERAVARTVTELRQLWRHARETFKATVIQQSFVNVFDPLFGQFDRFVSGSPARLVSRLNELVSAAAMEDGTLWLDIATASARDGLDAWFDVSRWLQGKIEIAPQSAPLYGELVARLIASQRGQSRKCLVLDLDNTLWGGVIGDDGIEGIRLGEGSGSGEAHLALQRYAKQLKERGIILAVCSKNDPAIAESAFREHPEMLLRRSDIAAFAANWHDKVDNLRGIAEQLNIGLDSLVFVDDNPAERARVRAALPMVAVPELPDDVAQYVRCLADAGYFETVSFTAEDRDRSEQYAANADRDALRDLSQSVGDFLGGLNMSVDFGCITAAHVQRVTQLLNKTNQFNTTTQRYTADEVAAFVGSADAIALQFRLVDRFGDNGLVSVMLMRRTSNDASIYEIENWVMSCRVFGRQLEHEAINIAVEALRARGVFTLRAAYLPTAKNGVIAELFDSLGFSRLADRADLAAGASDWHLDLSQYRPHQTFIKRKVVA